MKHRKSKIVIVLDVEDSSGLSMKSVKDGRKL
jgi:hypothetical protein